MDSHVCPAWGQIEGGVVGKVMSVIGVEGWQDLQFKPVCLVRGPCTHVVAGEREKGLEEHF